MISVFAVTACCVVWCMYQSGLCEVWLVAVYWDCEAELWYICVFQDHPAVVADLDIVDEDDQITHMLALEDGDSPDDGLSQFAMLFIPFMFLYCESVVACVRCYGLNHDNTISSLTCGKCSGESMSGLLQVSVNNSSDNKHTRLICHVLYIRHVPSPV